MLHEQAFGLEVFTGWLGAVAATRHREWELETGHSSIWPLRDRLIDPKTTSKIERFQGGSTSASIGIALAGNFS